MLDIKNVSVKFNSSSQVSAVEDVNMFIEPNSKNVLIGETGSGKSVLLLTILKLLPPSAQISGKIMFENRNLLDMKEKELEKIRGSKIAYIPQGSGNSLNPLLKIGFQVGEPMIEHNGLNKKNAICKSKELLKKFHLGREDEIVKSYPNMLSGGMKQRTMVAMGISAGANLILADEPTKGLDCNRISMVADCFNSLDNITILCVTHDINFAMSIGENISVMYAAQQVEATTKDEFFKNPLHPYSKAMLNAMPENGLICNVGFAPSHDLYLDSGCRFSHRCEFRTDKCAVTPPMFEKRGHKVRCWLYAD